jgi:hypothetical protein
MKSISFCTLGDGLPLAADAFQELFQSGQEIPVTHTLGAFFCHNLLKELALHAIPQFGRKGALHLPATECTGNCPTRPSAVLSPIGAVHAGLSGG